ncbi:MAG TPA: ATP-binding protein [Candidatus Hydrogenedentes bacterium]|nr:ATP-binding protein [Candidatus Hydrogenedentota bacterium]HRT21485.1 ATP-binding protein [Candidatus Hydrogenedentota bacterium]HRT66189.1 ATP-binding protein [Candidatus Hydrogenedentota bacterium]
MNLAVSTFLLLVSAALSCALGGIVIFRNPWKRTHRQFAILSLNLMLWSLGVVMIIHSRTGAEALFWLRTTFIVASFLPATFYHFIVFFPHQRFEGLRAVLALLYAGAFVQIAGTFTPWYVQSVTLPPGKAPLVVYGPVFLAYSFWVLLSMAFSFSDLIIKRSKATGIERRQIEHVLIGIFLTTTFASATNVLAPALKIGSLEAYGPIFTVVMMGFLAYAMIRYHLLDIWLLVSRTTIYAVVTVFVIATFLGTVSVVHWVFSSGGRAGNLFTTVLAALIIALVLQPLKERLQLFVERTVVKRRYDTNALCARITQTAAKMVRLDALLDAIARDIHATMGVDLIRLLLIDGKDPGMLVTEFSTQPGETRSRNGDQAALIAYLKQNPAPLILKKLLHERCTPETMRIARHLAELDAFACIPLWSSSGMVGILTLGEKNSGDIYSADDILVFETIAGPLGTAIENAQLYFKVENVKMHLERILANMPSGVVAADASGVVTHFNAGAVEMLGPVRAGQSIDELPAEIAGVLRQTMADVRGVGDFETVLSGPGGETIPVVISSSCLEGPGGSHDGALVMIHNQTQIKRLEQNVKRADRLSSIGTLAAGMAHEVKNPLVSIKTFTQLLPSRFDDADFRRTFSEVVPHEVERIDAIVSRLLNFARPKPVDFSRQDLRRIIEHVLALVENQTRKAGIEVRADFPEESLSVYGDEQQLHQVFLNLFLNAIDAMRASGEGCLAVQARFDRARLRGNGHTSFLETDCVRVTVSDTGAGILPEHVEHLFTPFFTTKAEGCGLGLSVVHGIVLEHGGEIDVTSTPGAGTSFTVTFPLLPGAVATQPLELQT